MGPTGDPTGRRLPLAHQKLDGIALLGIQAAQLVLDIDTGLATHIDQVFALDVQFPRQYVDSDLLFLQELTPGKQNNLQFGEPDQAPMPPAAGKRWGQIA
jgi:hypothetical protein